MPAVAVHPFERKPQPIPVNLNRGFGIPVYFAGEHPVAITLDAVVYRFEPRRSTTIHGTFRHPTNDKGKVMLDQEPERKLSADEIADALINRAGERGLVMLTGDAATDEILKSEAYKRWVTWRLEECARIIQAHELACNRAIQFKAIPPMPSPAWRLAMKDYKRLTEMAQPARKRYICPKDGLDFSEREGAAAHFREMHPSEDFERSIIDTRPGKAESPDADIEEEERVTPVAARVDEPKSAMSALKAAASQIFARAGEEGVTLPDEIRQMLKSDDEESIRLALDEAAAIIDGPSHS